MQSSAGSTVHLAIKAGVSTIPACRSVCRLSSGDMGLVVSTMYTSERWLS